MRPVESRVDQDVAHDTGGHRKEVCAVLPWDVMCVDQPQIRVVHERCGLQTVTNGLMTHVLPCDAMEFVYTGWQMETLFMVVCPYCGEEVEIYLEPDIHGSVVQDCEVCCNPWRLRIVDEDGERWVEVRRADGSE